MKKMSVFLAIILFAIQVNAESAFKRLGTGESSLNQSVFLVELFKNLDKEKLKAKDSSETIKYITEKNLEIKNYLIKTYPDEEFEKLDVNDPGTLIVGLMTAVAEENNFQPIKESSSTQGGPSLEMAELKPLPAWAVCAMEVITGMFDIVGLYNEYVALFTSTSTSWGSVASVVGRTLRRHFGWVAAAYLVYDISTSCF